MPSELSRKLDDFRTKQKVVPVTQKVSFLFDPSRAAGLDILSLAIIARKSLLDLAELEPSLSVFEDLFIGTYKNVEFLSQPEHAELSLRVKRLLSFLSGHLKSLDAQQCLEYLIQKYRIHLYNGEDLILCALPYHDTPLFGKVVQVLAFFKKIERATASEARWMFLRNVYKTGSPLSRKALVKMCRSSQPVMTAIIDHVIDSIKFGACNEALLSFANVLLLEVLSEFSAIKYDISIPLFSLCRICFKASQQFVSAFFVGLTLSIHIVCVADVRDDALGILLSRAVTVCPSGKAHALLMGLNVVAKRRGALPKSIIDALERVSCEELESGVRKCGSRASLVPLKDAVKESSILVDRFNIEIPTSEAEPSVPVVSPDQELLMDDADAQSSSSDDEEEDDALTIARKELNKLIQQGSVKDRKAAIAKYSKIPGTGRLCIRLAALCNCLDSLRIATKNLSNDSGFVPLLISVLPQFEKTDPYTIFESIFREMKSIPQNALAEVAESLNIHEAAALMAVEKNMESEFVLSSANVWKAVAAVAAGSSQLGRLKPISEWKFISWKIENPKEFCNRFVEFANKQSKRSATGDRIETLLAQLMCAITIPGSTNRLALTNFVNRSFSEMTDSLRSEFLALAISQQNSTLVKKLNELSFSKLKSIESLENSVREMLNACPNSPDVWTLAKSIIDSGLKVSDVSLLLSPLEKATPSSSAFKCFSSNWDSVKSRDAALRLVNIIIAAMSSSSGTVGDVVQTMMETLLIVFGGSVTDVDNSLLKSLISILVEASVKFQGSHDTLVLTIQSVCESALAGMDFDAAWTTLLELAASSQDEAIRIRLYILFATVIAREDVDSEQVTSKQLGQVILGFADLVVSSSSSSSVGSDQIDSWAALPNSEGSFTPLISCVIQKCISQFLLHCTLRKLDKMFRRLVQLTTEAEKHKEAKLALVLRVYATVCEQGGSAATLALLPLASDAIMSALKYSNSSTSSSKRKRNSDVLIAALRAVAASCVEEVPESNITDFIEAVSDVPGKVDDLSLVAEACIGLARVGSTDQIKSFTKQLMQRTIDSSASSAVQEAVVGTILAMWKGVGESMVPAITEVTVFLNELYRSKDPEVRAVTKQLVKEIDRVTGEDIQGKLADNMDEED